jgi:hypothetical protein
MREVSKMDFDVCFEEGNVCRIFKGPGDRVGVEMVVRNTRGAWSGDLESALQSVATWAWNSALKEAGLP